MTLKDDLIRRELDAHPYPMIFATVSGAHLYGFPSPDSDYDLRGVHALPLEELVGLRKGPETVERSGIREGVEMDVVTQELRKFIRLMLKRNGYVLEQLYSPLVLRTSESHRELKELGMRCVTRHHVHHYLGFADNQWRLFRKEEPPRVKPLLYVFRVLLTGIHLMRTGGIEANLVALNQEFRLPFLDELIQLKLAGPEKGRIDQPKLEAIEREFLRLFERLKEEGERSGLPEEPSAMDGLNALLLRVRLGRG
jgi:predicted nucleotidyltransferase